MHDYLTHIELSEDTLGAIPVKLKKLLDNKLLGADLYDSEITRLMLNYLNRVELSENNLEDILTNLKSLQKDLYIDEKQYKIFSDVVLQKTLA